MFFSVKCIPLDCFYMSVQSGLSVVSQKGQFLKHLKGYLQEITVSQIKQWISKCALYSFTKYPLKADSAGNTGWHQECQLNLSLGNISCLLRMFFLLSILFVCLSLPFYFPFPLYLFSPVKESVCATCICLHMVPMKCQFLPWLVQLD